MVEKRLKVAAVILLPLFVCMFLILACEPMDANPGTDASVLVKIEVTKGPNKTNYYEGETFSATGMVVTAYYDNNTSKPVTDYTFSPTGALSLTDTKVTISYSGKSTQVSITVRPNDGLPFLDRIEVTTPPYSTIYEEGETFSAEGMVVTAYFDDGTSETVTDYTISSTDTLSLSDTFVTITYQGEIITVSITVRPEGSPPILERIAVTTPPAKTTFYEGDTFDTDGMVVTVYYSGGISGAATSYMITPAGPLSQSDTKVTISYGGKTTSVDITVLPAALLDRIEVTTQPSKTTYTTDQTFSAAGMVVTAYYDNNTSKPVTDYTFSPTGPLSVSDTAITISYNGQTTVVAISVVEMGDYFSDDFDETLCSFYDKFDGSGTNLSVGGVDLSKWGFQNGNGSNYGQNGWGNAERQSYKTDNSVVADGILTITAKNEVFDGKNFTSGKLVTANSKGTTSLGEPAAGAGIKFGQTYGRFEAKIRMNAARGAWPAFWMMPVSSSYGGWPRSGEIDIMEMVGINKTRASSTLHMKPSWGTWESQYQGVNHTFRDSGTFEDWHVYGVKWTATEMTFLIDGYRSRTLTRTWWNSSWYAANGFPSSDNNYPPFNRDFHFIINLALDSGQFNQQNALGNNEAITPYTLEVDWVRAYTNENDPWVALNYPSNLMSNHGN